MKNFNSGQVVNQGYYAAFIPEGINRDWQIEDMEVIRLLSTADRQIGRLDMYSGYVNIDLYISMHIAKEATQSSRIEGTQTNMQEAFLEKEEINDERRNDWEEVQNYIAAMNKAVAELNNLPFSSRLIRQAHEVLLQGVRGEHKLPGEYRLSQNWIGGASINDAKFVPPPHLMVPELMSDLEKFANDDMNPMPDLLKIALIHYQFETIHPFLDGNGRVGRLLIPVYLVSKGILKRPILYLSDFFENHRMLYYDNLMRVRTHQEISQWFKFFLTGIIDSCEKGIATFDSILQLQRSLDQRLVAIGSKESDARKVLESLYKRPVIGAKRVAEIIGKSQVSAYKLISELEKIGILQEITGSGRGRVYAFKEYLDLFKND